MGRHILTEIQILPQTPHIWQSSQVSGNYSLKPALDIPYGHHDKWDGRGYPQGLKEEQIPLAARLFAVVDVWDALTNDRPYRQRWSQQSTLDYINQQSGAHFDPRVVELFLTLLGDGVLHV
ncbi:MAG: hypothetical protein L0Z70_02330 [Chloroflexi bacterium]|nr:hypothetical protein [Chloroflexota bacterium]